MHNLCYINENAIQQFWYNIEMVYLGLFRQTNTIDTWSEINRFLDIVAAV